MARNEVNVFEYRHICVHTNKAGELKSINQSSRVYCRACLYLIVQFGFLEVNVTIRAVIGIILILVLLNISYGILGTYYADKNRNPVKSLEYACSSNPLTNSGFNLYLISIEGWSTEGDGEYLNACKYIGK